jgi:hypothetical protein
VRGRLLAALALAVLLAPAARASVEEFSTYHVAVIESDDENFFDHWLVRTPLRWEDEYRAAPNAFRTSQGCYTAGQWYQGTDFKARAALGKSAYLDIGLLQMFDDLAQYQWLRFEFRFRAGGAGTFGFRFQPTQDKSKQDFAALWDWGEPGGPLEIGAAFRAHPVEPALRVAARGTHHRIEVEGKWLTPLRADVLEPDQTKTGGYSLWGAKGALLAIGMTGPWEFEARGADQQALSHASTTGIPGDGHNFRRLWRVEGAVRRRIGSAWTAEARGAYQERDENWQPPVADAEFLAIDRGLAAELAGEPRKNWHVRVGLMHDRIGVEQQGSVPVFTWGTRKESRAYLGLEALFGRVRVQGIEGIELDAEPYEVTFHHDKGYLQLQTTF